MYYILISIHLIIHHTYDDDDYTTETLDPIFKNTLTEANECSKKEIEKINEGITLINLGKLNYDYHIEDIDVTIDKVRVTV